MWKLLVKYVGVVGEWGWGSMWVSVGEVGG